MKPLILIIITALTLSCSSTKQEKYSPDSVNWGKRKTQLPTTDSLYKGSSYLSVYSEIYQRNEQQPHGLTATVSIRNISLTDSVYILKADYYNTTGDLIKTYFDYPIYIKPLETVEIIIDEQVAQGQTSYLIGQQKTKTQNPILKQL